MRDIWDNGIDGSESLCRYLRAERCVYVMGNARVYFAATRFPDRFEGAVAVRPYGFHIDPRYPEFYAASSKAVAIWLKP
jgi:hypothetical protein